MKKMKSVERPYDRWKDPEERVDPRNAKRRRGETYHEFGTESTASEISFPFKPLDSAPVIFLPRRRDSVQKFV